VTKIKNMQNNSYPDNKQTLQGVDIKPLLTIKHILTQRKRSKSSFQAIKQIPIMSENYIGRLLKKHKQKHNSKPTKAENHHGYTRHPESPLATLVEHQPFRKHQQPNQKKWTVGFTRSPNHDACKLHINSDLLKKK
jgi:hypothetical protein